MNESPARVWSQPFRMIGEEVASSRRILLVDDEHENLEVLGALLEDDFEIHVAHGGREALAMCSSLGDVAAVISDQRMPGMTGIELLTELGRRAPATVRMVVTAYSDLGPIVAAVNDGCVHRFFLKPWNPHEMRSAAADAVWTYEAEGALNRLVALLAVRKRDLAATLARLKRSQNELLAFERMSTLGRFSAGITHNIRNSLTVMMHLLDVVQQNPTEEGLVRSAQHAFQTLDALLSLANDVSALARGRLDAINCCPVEMTPFLERTAAAFGHEPLGASHPVEITIAPSSRVLAFDHVRVGKALVALLRSCAHTSARGTPLQIVIHPMLGHGEVCLEVRSQPSAGGGLDGQAANQTAIAALEPGRLVPAPGSPEAAELALGLEVSRVVAEAHGGRLVIKPRPGMGDAISLWIGDADPEGK